MYLSLTEVGEIDGDCEGSVIGDLVGLWEMVGLKVILEGSVEGSFVGDNVGRIDGNLVGKELGKLEGV